MMHGPLQFHLVALSFLLFGDNDFTARIPVVLFSIATVLFMWNYRRYLGRVGAWVAAGLFLISPYMLFYGRYVRNESFVALFGVMTIWAALRYFETGQVRYIFWLTGVIVLHFTAKETSYIYVAQLLLFLGLYFFLRLWRRNWQNDEARIPFVIAFGSGLVFGAAAFISRSLGAAPKEGAEGYVASASGATFQTGLLALILFTVLALLVAIYFLIAGHHRPRLTPLQRQYLVLALVGIPVALGLALAYGYFGLRGSSTTARLAEFAGKATISERTGAIPYILVVIGVTFIPSAALLYCGYLLGQAIKRVWPFGRERSFDMLMLVGTLILPALSAFLIKLYADPNATDLANVTLMTVILLPMMALSAGLGIGWSQRLWLQNAALYYSIFVVLYTTFFTNIAGFFTGIVGSLGYWIAQQAVQRGSQPWFYYALIQIPMYEFLPALGCLLTAGILIYRMARGKWRTAEDKPTEDESQSLKSALRAEPAVQADSQPAWQHAPALRLMAFWVVSSLFAFSYAGEKMPWLTVHIVLPMILLAGWGIGRLIETVDWLEFRHRQGWVVVILLPLFLTSMAGLLNGTTDLLSILRGGASTATNLDVWTLVGRVVIALVSAFASGWGIIYLLRDWLPENFIRLLGVLAFLVLGVLTARAAMMASYQNYDLATEYLVFAHCGPGPKLALKQIESLSERMTGGTGIRVAYDDKTTYPFWWYLRDYPNYVFYGDVPNRDLRDVPLILVGDSNYEKIEPIVRDDYYMFEYVRMWWPNQDYMVYQWTLKRLWDTFQDTRKRQAVLNIWLNRDYARYGEVFQRDMYLPNWDPSEHFRLYIRKDVAAELWSYSTNPQAVNGPYEGKQVSLVADRMIGSPGADEGQFASPRGISVASDGSLYVVDTGNSRIQHLSPQGEVLHVWGTRYEGEGSAPPGQFKEPWDVAVGPDGSVYVADTWNHRVQKFTADGQYLTSWGSGILSDPGNLLGFFGPRGIAVNDQGQVFITDTGNKRIVYFNENGTPLGQFGEGGMNPGQFDEPVGMSFDSSGNLYVADTWNQRVQVFNKGADGGYAPVSEWDVRGWEGITATNYPYLAADTAGHVFTTDPDNGRVIEYSSTGEVVRYWEDAGASAGSFNFPVGIAVDSEGGVWVVDSGNGRLLHFTLP
jgi:DNA-binding beta-propeller fold protein YncE